MSALGEATTNPTVVNADLNINQHASFKLTYQLLDSASATALDITSWSFSASISQQFVDLLPSVYFTSSVVDLTQSIVEFTLTPAQTALMTGTRYVYDIVGIDKSTTPDTVYRLAQGKVRVYLGSTIPTVTE
jgi:hypothetical protein